MTEVPVSSGTPAGSSGIYRHLASKGPFSPGTKAYVQHNFGATGAPGVGDDDADKYGVGSLWYDTTNENLYICKDATTGAAVWRQLSYGATIATLKDALNDAAGKGRRTINAQAAASALTGTTSQTALRTIAIPANSMGANGRIVLEFKVSRTGAGGTCTINVYFGTLGTSGDKVFEVSLSAANATGIYRLTIENQNNAAIQVGGGAGLTSFGNSATAIYGTTQDTTSAVNLIISATLVNSGDSVTLVRSDVEVLRAT